MSQSAKTQGTKPDYTKQVKKRFAEEFLTFQKNLNHNLSLCRIAF